MGKREELTKSLSKTLEYLMNGGDLGCFQNVIRDSMIFWKKRGDL